MTSVTLISMLLQMLVAEAGLKLQPDHPAMLGAIENLADRADLTLEQTVIDHVSEFSNGFPERRMWITRLSTACTEPKGWHHGRWKDVGQRNCFQLVRLIRDFRSGRVRSPCKGAPDQWRSRRFPKLQRAARRRGWRRIGCGRDTLHVFWDTGRR